MGMHGTEDPTRRERGLLKGEWEEPGEQGGGQVQIIAQPTSLLARLLCAFLRARRLKTNRQTKNSFQ